MIEHLAIIAVTKQAQARVATVQACLGAKQVTVLTHDLAGQVGRLFAASTRETDVLSVPVETPVEEQVAASTGETDVLSEPPVTLLVSMLAVGATVRLIAPHLRSKHTDPAVISIDETARFVVVVTGAHHGGNTAATLLAACLNAQPVITTASDRLGLPNLDNLDGLGVHPDYDHRATVMRQIIDTGKITCFIDPQLIDPQLDCATTSVGTPKNTAGSSVIFLDDPSQLTDGCVVFSTRQNIADLIPSHLRVLVLQPQHVVLGIGASKNCPYDELHELVTTVLAQHNIAPGSISGVATHRVKADEQAIVQLCNTYSWSLTLADNRDLADINVPHPSEHVYEALGIRSVSEASAIWHSQGELLVPKTKSTALKPGQAAMATVAIAGNSHAACQRISAFIDQWNQPLTTEKRHNNDKS